MRAAGSAGRVPTGFRCRVAALVFGVAASVAGIGVTATTDGAIITNTVSVTAEPFAGNPTGVVTYAVTATAMVANPCSRVLKIVTPEMAPAGGTLTYRIWVEGCSAMVSSFNVTATDRLPDNTSYAGQYSSWSGTAPGSQWFESHSADGSAWSAGEPAIGQGSPYFMRWRLNALGIGGSAYIEFAVRIE